MAYREKFSLPIVEFNNRENTDMDSYKLQTNQPSHTLRQTIPRVWLSHSSTVTRQALSSLAPATLSQRQAPHNVPNMVNPWSTSIFLCRTTTKNSTYVPLINPEFSCIKWSLKNFSTINSVVWTLSGNSTHVDTWYVRIRSRWAINFASASASNSQTQMQSSSLNWVSNPFH